MRQLDFFFGGKDSFWALRRGSHFERFLEEPENEELGTGWAIFEKTWLQQVNQKLEIEPVWFSVIVFSGYTYFDDQPQSAGYWCPVLHV